MLMLVRMGMPMVMIALFILMMMMMAVIVVVVMIMVAVVVMMAVAVIVGFVLVVRVGRSFVDAKFHAFHFLPLLPVEMHMKISDIELGELPFQGGGLDAEIDEGADGHVATDAGETIEEEDFHGGG